MADGGLQCLTDLQYVESGQFLPCDEFVLKVDDGWCRDDGATRRGGRTIYSFSILFSQKVLFEVQVVNSAACMHDRHRAGLR